VALMASLPVPDDPGRRPHGQGPVSPLGRCAVVPAGPPPWHPPSAAAKAMKRFDTACQRPLDIGQGQRANSALHCT